jgi:hypothetical protein
MLFGALVSGKGFDGGAQQSSITGDAGADKCQQEVAAGHHTLE